MDSRTREKRWTSHILLDCQRNPSNKIIKVLKKQQVYVKTKWKTEKLIEGIFVKW